MMPFFFFQDSAGWGYNFIAIDGVPSGSRDAMRRRGGIDGGGHLYRVLLPVYWFAQSTSPVAAGV
jgi:hypothetical protein